MAHISHCTPKSLYYTKPYKTKAPQKEPTMHEPTYKPNQWVLYELDADTAGFGVIVGGVFNDATWHYNVRGVTDSETNVQVSQDEVKYILENGNWTAPQHFGGSNSAYAAGGVEG